MSNQEITQTIDKATNTYVERSVFGLNIFRANKVVRSIPEDPQLELLRQICSQNDTAVNIGNLYDYVDSHEELFDETKYSKDYSVVRIGSYGSEFYDSEEWTTLPPLLFTNVLSDFIDITNREESLIRKILQVDAIAFFISPKNESSMDELRALLNSQFVSTESLISKAIDLYRLLGMSHADGDYLSFLSKDKQSLASIDEPLTSAVALVETSDWYQENRDNLLWDGEYSMCLRQP